MNFAKKEQEEEEESSGEEEESDHDSNGEQRKSQHTTNTKGSTSTRKKPVKKSLSQQAAEDREKIQKLGESGVQTAGRALPLIDLVITQKEFNQAISLCDGIMKTPIVAEMLDAEETTRQAEQFLMHTVHSHSKKEPFDKNKEDFKSYCARMTSNEFKKLQRIFSEHGEEICAVSQKLFHEKKTQEAYGETATKARAIRDKSKGELTTEAAVNEAIENQHILEDDEITLDKVLSEVRKKDKTAAKRSKTSSKKQKTSKKV